MIYSEEQSIYKITDIWLHLFLKFHIFLIKIMSVFSGKKLLKTNIFY